METRERDNWDVIYNRPYETSFGTPTEKQHFPPRTPAWKGYQENSYTSPVDQNVEDVNTHGALLTTNPEEEEQVQEEEPGPQKKKKRRPRKKKQKKTLSVSNMI